MGITIFIVMFGTIALVSALVIAFLPKERRPWNLPFRKQVTLLLVGYALSALLVRVMLITRYDIKDFCVRPTDTRVVISPIFTVDRWTMENIERGSRSDLIYFDICLVIAYPCIAIETAFNSTIYANDSLAWKKITAVIRRTVVGHYDRIFFDSIDADTITVYRSPDGNPETLAVLP